MDTLEALLQTWETDCVLDQSEPGKELIKIPKLHAKYLRALIKSKLQLKNLKDIYAESRKVKWNYYKGNYNTNKEMLEKLGLEPFKLILNSDIIMYLDTDKELVEHSKKITYYEEMIRALDLIMIELKNRGYNIQSLIQWTRFVAGA
jgi:predicted PolB exonuclease-like 3'-5' exonuclease